MATSTPNLALSKPSDTENYDVGVHNANMDKLDTAIKSDRDRLTAAEGRLTTLDTTDPADASAGITAAANWTLNSLDVRKVGKLVSVAFQVTRTNSAITTNANGNIGNTALFTMPAGYRPFAGHDPTWASGGGNSDMPCMGMMQSTGIVYVTLSPPNIPIAVGTVISGQMCYIADT